MQNMGDLAFEYEVGVTNVKGLDIDFASLKFTDLSLGVINRLILINYNHAIEPLKSIVLNAFRDKISGIVSNEVSSANESCWMMHEPSS